MTEIIDLYDNARQFARTIEHGAPVPDGLNRYSVHVWFVNSNNQILLQQRLHNNHKDVIKISAKMDGPPPPVNVSKKSVLRLI